MSPSCVISEMCVGELSRHAGLTQSGLHNLPPKSHYLGIVSGGEKLLMHFVLLISATLASFLKSRFSYNCCVMA